MYLLPTFHFVRLSKQGTAANGQRKRVLCMKKGFPARYGPLWPVCCTSRDERRIRKEHEEDLSQVL